jgi:hypothetical protein
MLLKCVAVLKIGEAHDGARGHNGDDHNRGGASHDAGGGGGW